MVMADLEPSLRGCIAEAKVGWSRAGEPGGLPSALPSAWASGSQGAAPLPSGLLGVDLRDPVAES